MRLRRRPSRAHLVFDFPLPPGTETYAQRAHRKAEVRSLGEIARARLFAILAANLGQVEAARMTGFPPRQAKAGIRKRPSSKQAEDDYLLRVVEDVRSIKKAAERVHAWHPAAFGASIEAIEQRIDRLLRVHRNAKKA
jgi:hypothetical protein